MVIVLVFLQNFLIYCRDRRPRLSVTIYAQRILYDFLIFSSMILTVLILRTVEDACPYSYHGNILNTKIILS